MFKNRPLRTFLTVLGVSVGIDTIAMMELAGFLATKPLPERFPLFLGSWLGCTGKANSFHGYTRSMLASAYFNRKKASASCSLLPL